MKATFVGVIAVILGVVLAIQAQNMVEYSQASTQAATSLKAPVEKLGSALQKTVAKSADTGNGPAIWEEKTIRGRERPLAKPLPPAIFVLSNGERIESSNYILRVDSLRVEQNGTQRTIPMSGVNVKATLAANHERGIDLKIPTDNSQIMLGF